ncbi:MAG: hypothetical protein ACI91Q_000061 [Gammaproteobacteria bacterium]
MGHLRRLAVATIEPASVTRGAIGCKIAPNPTLPSPKFAVSAAIDTMAMPTNNANFGDHDCANRDSEDAPGKEKCHAEASSNDREDDHASTGVLVDREAAVEKNSCAGLTVPAAGDPREKHADDADQRPDHHENRAKLDVRLRRLCCNYSLLAGGGWRRLTRELSGWLRC